MVTLAGAIIAYLRAFFVPRHKLVLEAVALRQQLAVVKRKQPRPKLDPHDRGSGLCSVGCGTAGPKP